MIIQQSTISRVRDESAEKLRPFVEDGTHRIAVTSDMLEPSELTSVSSPTISGDGFTVTGVSISEKKGLTDAQKQAIEKAFVNVSNAALPQLKKYFPEITGPIEGIELILSTKTAFDSWADPENKTIVKPMLKTTRAVFELIDVVRIAIPRLDNVPYMNEVGVLIKVGDSVWQFYHDVSTTISTVERQKGS